MQCLAVHKKKKIYLVWQVFFNDIYWIFVFLILMFYILYIIFLVQSPQGKEVDG